MKLTAGLFSDVGQVRELNEDYPLVDERLALFAVADGMGGHQGGEVASRTAIEALRAAVASGLSINDAIVRANDAVLKRAEGADELAGMGTTMTAVVVVGGQRLLIGHVGDSRAYLLRDGHLERITEDHSLVEELVREGRLTPEQAEVHPQRAIITRALGVEDDLEVDLYTVHVQASDRLLVCSDGLTTMLRDREVERIARTESDPQRAAEALVDAANAAGGEDNITVVVLDVVEVDAEDPPDPIALAAPEEALDDAAAPAAASASVGGVASPATPTASDAKPPREKGARLRGIRGALLVVVPLVVILGVATAAVGWYARRSYYVGAAGREVVIYKGVPGGVLGWNPTVEQRSGIEVADLEQIDRDRVADGAARGSLARAESFVDHLQERIDATSTTTTSSTTTTRPLRPTVTTRPATAAPTPTT
jgi:protein phosphatase